MASNNKYIGKISDSNLDEWLSSLGFLCPITNIQLERFEKCFDDFPFKLENATIDVEAIMNGTYKRKTKIINLIPNDIENNIDELKMVARNGSKNLPLNVLKKMKENQDKFSKSDR